jgi:hypothetical protein
MIRDILDLADFKREEPDGRYVYDSYFYEASKEIQELYKTNPQAVFYIRQLQVKFEKKYYHWITRNAIVGLEKIGLLKQTNISVISSGNKLELHFFTHPTNRYPKRAANELAKIVAEYSQDHIMRSCGNRAEVLFAEGLATKGFTIYMRKANSYGRKKWTKSGHNLDYIIERNGIAYGCEIKNKLDYIEKNELDIKLKMCKHLGIRPLFIMRASPTCYNNMIINAGGFALIFEAQIYDLSQKYLVEKIRMKLGYKADCPRSIPEGIINRFYRWHDNVS